MKIKKKGNRLSAYRDENDVDNICGMNSKIKIGDFLGSINIKTEKFTGNTICIVELSKKLQMLKKQEEEKFQGLVDEVINQIVYDADNGDVTVLEEILKKVPKENLIQSLPEEEWEKHR